MVEKVKQQISPNLASQATLFLHSTTARDCGHSCAQHPICGIPSHPPHETCPKIKGTNSFSSHRIFVKKTGNYQKHLHGQQSNYHSFNTHSPGTCCTQRLTPQPPRAHSLLLDLSYSYKVCDISMVIRTGARALRTVLIRGRKLRSGGQQARSPPPDPPGSGTQVISTAAERK